MTAKTVTGTLVLLVVLAVTLVVHGQEARKTRFEIPKKDIPSAGELGKATLVTDLANIVALELVGSWEIDNEAYKALNPQQEHLSEVSAIAFKDDEPSTKTILERLSTATPGPDQKDLDAFSAAMRESVRFVYKAGSMEIVKEGRTAAVPFALVTWRGNPTLLFAGNSSIESALISLGRDVKGDNDILYLGGDHTDESMVPYRRKKKE